MAFLLSNIANRAGNIFRGYETKYGDPTTMGESLATQRANDEAERLRQRAKLKDEKSDAFSIQLAKKFREMNPDVTKAKSAQDEAMGKSEKAKGSLAQLKEMYKANQLAKQGAQSDKETQYKSMEDISLGIQKLREANDALDAEIKALSPDAVSSLEQLNQEKASNDKDIEVLQSQLEGASGGYNAASENLSFESNKAPLNLDETDANSAEAASKLAQQNYITAKQNDPYEMYAQAAELDPTKAFTEYNDLQTKQLQLKTMADFKTAEPIGNMIEDLYATQVGLMQKYPDGQMPTDIKDTFDANQKQIAELGNKYTTLTKGKRYDSVTAADYRKAIAGRKDAAEIKKAIVDAKVAEGEYQIKLGDRYDKVIHDATNYVQKSQMAINIGIMNTLVNQVARIKTAIGSDYASNSGYVRAMVVAFNKLLEPSSAVMQGDFTSSTGVPDAGFANTIQELGRVVSLLKDNKAILPNPETTSAAQYIISPAQVTSLEKAYSAASGILPTLKKQMYRAGMTEVKSRLGNPHYNAAGLAQLNDDDIMKMMAGLSGYDTPTNPAEEVPLPDSPYTKGDDKSGKEGANVLKVGKPAPVPAPKGGGKGSGAKIEKKLAEEKTIKKIDRVSKKDRKS